jgi:hypothetical protein
MAAGFVAAHSGVTIKFDGTPVAIVAGEAMSQISGKYYRVTDAAKRCLDHRQNLEIRDNGVAVAATNIEHIDYLNGIVKFAASYTVTGPVTIQVGTYIPFTTLGVVKSFSFDVSADLPEKTVFGNTSRRYLRGLADFTIDLAAFDHLESAAGVETLEASLNSGTTRIISIEIIQDGSTLANGGLLVRGLVKLQNPSTDADPGSIVETGSKFEGCPVMSTNALVSGSWPVSWSVLDGASGLYI